MLGLVVCGLRTWMCTIAAPALAASIEERAICSGVTGTAGLRPGVSAEPVTAQEMMTLRCMVCGYSPPQRRCPVGRIRTAFGAIRLPSTPSIHGRLGQFLLADRECATYHG